MLAWFGLRSKRRNVPGRAVASVIPAINPASRVARRSHPALANPDFSEKNPQYLTNMSWTLFFSANDGVHGRELDPSFLRSRPCDSLRFSDY